MFVLKFIKGSTKDTYVKYCMLTPHSCILRNGRLIEALRFDTTEDAKSLLGKIRKIYRRDDIEVKEVTCYEVE